MRPVLLAHGLEGRPDGTKARALRGAGLTVHCPDCRSQALAQRVAVLGEVAAANPGAVWVGSSYGGLALLALLSARPELAPPGLVLAAPALHWSEPPVDDAAALLVPIEVPTIVVHGTSDTIVPVAVSRALVARCPHVQLREVDDDHLLRRSLPDLIAAVRQLCGPELT